MGKINQKEKDELKIKKKKLIKILAVCQEEYLDGVSVDCTEFDGDDDE